MGNPLDPATELGPLATARVRADVAAQVDDARRNGAVVLCGGTPAEGPGFFYPATVVRGVTPEMRADREELFGPVAGLHRVRDADEAIEVANRTAFGLGASVWTRHPDEMARFAEEIEAGMVFINAMVISTPELPFGGTKRSGYGRELGAWGIREFCNVQTRWIR